MPNPIRIASFRGERPGTGPRLLPDGFAQSARNCRLIDGQIVPMSDVTDVETITQVLDHRALTSDGYQSAVQYVRNRRFSRSKLFWTEGGGWEILGGKAQHTPGNAGNISQSMDREDAQPKIKQGLSYTIEYTVSDYQLSDLSAALQFDDTGSSFVDETLDANSPTGSDWEFFPLGAGVDDICYIASASATGRINIQLGVAGIGAYTLAWEYSLGGDTWGDLETGFNFLDNTLDLKAAAGNYDITFDPPTDWAVDTVNALGPFFWIRAKRDAGTVTTDPLGTRGFAADGFVQPIIGGQEGTKRYIAGTFVENLTASSTDKLIAFKADTFADLKVDEIGVTVDLATFGTVNFIRLQWAASDVLDEYNNFTVVTVGGTGSGQTRTVSKYWGNDNGKFHAADVSVPFSPAVDDTTEYELYKPVTANEVQSLYLFDKKNQALFFRWGTDVDVTRTPIAADEKEITIWTGQGVPKISHLGHADVQPAGFTTTGFPKQSYTLGVPAPRIDEDEDVGTGGNNPGDDFFLTYSSNVDNVDLFGDLQAVGWDGVTWKNFIIKINPGVRVGSVAAGTGFTITASWPVNTILNISNCGTINGGHGAAGAPNGGGGGVGGTGLFIDPSFIETINFTNETTGLIFNGGGGGGAGGFGRSRSELFKGCQEGNCNIVCNGGAGGKGEGNTSQVGGGGGGGCPCPQGGGASGGNGGAGGARNVAGAAGGVGSVQSGSGCAGPGGGGSGAAAGLAAIDGVSLITLIDNGTITGPQIN